MRLLGREQDRHGGNGGERRIVTIGLNSRSGSYLFVIRVLRDITTSFEFGDEFPSVGK